MNSVLLISKHKENWQTEEVSWLHLALGSRVILDFSVINVTCVALNSMKSWSSFHWWQWFECQSLDNTSAFWWKINTPWPAVLTHWSLGDVAIMANMIIILVPQTDHSLFWTFTSGVDNVVFGRLLFSNCSYTVPSTVMYYTILTLHNDVDDEMMQYGCFQICVLYHSMMSQQWCLTRFCS